MIPRLFPLELANTPWTRKTTRFKSMHNLWGKIRVPIQCLEHRTNGSQKSVFLDSSLDSSGWTPYGLELLSKLVLHLPAETATELAHHMNIPISRAELDRLNRDLGQACNQEHRAALLRLAYVPLEKYIPPPVPLKASTAQQPHSETVPREITPPVPRVMVLQMDGCLVLGQPEEGRCGGIEVKTACIYPENAPRERVLYSTVGEAKDFCDPVSGLLRQAKVRPEDTVVVVADGATWISRIAELQGFPLIIDVYHTSEYLEKVIKAAQWTDEQRIAEQRSLLRGEIDIKGWLKSHLPKAEKRENWPEEAQIAVKYLEERVSHMEYPTYKARGWPIGSGQIEGINKSVIGHRMKRSGQHWSRIGAAGMAALRARHYSRGIPLLSFEHLRRVAFPTSQI
jgi:hypothetical protein